MKQYSANNIINIVLAGHSGSGKTSLVESMAYLSGTVNTLGKIEKGNTICDFDDEEIQRKISISSALVPVEWKDKKINIIDTPGNFDFAQSVYEGFRAAETAVITVSGKDGVCVGTEKMVELADEKGLSKIFFVNGLCDESARFYRVFESLKASFGPAVCPVVVPFIVNSKADCYVNIFENKAYFYKENTVKEVAMPDMGNRFDGLKTAIYEAVAQTSEELFEKYFSGKAFTRDEIINGIKMGVKEGTIYPVFCGDAQNTYGIDQFLNGINWLCPSAKEGCNEIAENSKGEKINLTVNEDDEPCGVVFKTSIDPFIGRISYIKVITGKISTDTTLINMRTGASEKINKVFNIIGKNQKEVPCISAGDIGVILKANNIHTSDTLCSMGKKLVLSGVSYPKPTLSMAVKPLNNTDEDKIVASILRLADEDPTIGFNNNIETHEIILSGLGEQHLDVIISKLKNKFSLDVELKVPKVPYRETILKSVKVQGKHKKQTGGHGQFGDVWIKFEPCENSGLTFAENIVGGAIPKGFFPAIEKGLLECIKKGPVAGFPVVGLKATLYDGSYHPVDSSEMAFKAAAALAYKNGLPKADPILLEPVGELDVIIPTSCMGDVIGEITKRRGKILGMEQEKNNAQKISAEVPVAEMQDFSVFIKRSTQNRGSFSFDFNHYEPAPADISNKVINSI